ncbi:hypothetical protein DBR17_03860 [Sphingomonas sp. HMWF008]|nr:hypothetical protein DBR17_03860 [Sphingomonas sp. HMWF008]
MSEQIASDPGAAAVALGRHLRAVRGPVIALLLVCAVGHVVSWTLAERYLQPACTAAAAKRQWRNLGYRLPGPSGRRSYCILEDADGSDHLISANRLVLFGFLFDPWLMSFLVGLPGLLILLRRWLRSW